METKKKYRKGLNKKEWKPTINKNIDLVKNNFPFYVESKRIELSKKYTNGERILKKGEFYQLIAENIGVSKSTVEQMIKGVSLPSIITALKLAKFLDLPIEKIFELREDKENE